MANVTGRVVQILGGVVDVEFPDGQVPELFEAIHVERSGKEPLVLEVQKHIGDNWVRTVAMDSTDGLQRGESVEVDHASVRGQVEIAPDALEREQLVEVRKRRVVVDREVASDLTKRP